MIGWESRSDSSGSISTVSTSCARKKIMGSPCLRIVAISEVRHSVWHFTVRIHARVQRHSCNTAHISWRATASRSREAPIEVGRSRIRRSEVIAIVLPMYNSELFKTVWTKVGRMCGYITCARSYLSGQYTVREKSPNLSFGCLAF